MSEQTASIRISLQNAGEAQSLFGPQDGFLKIIESEIPAIIDSREAELTIRGAEREVDMLGQLFNVLLSLIRSGYILTERDVQYAVKRRKIFVLINCSICSKEKLLQLFAESLSVSKRSARSIM